MRKAWKELKRKVCCEVEEAEAAFRVCGPKPANMPLT